MDQRNREDEQQRTLAQALKRADLKLEELWVRYFGLGGDAGLIDVDAYIHGLGGLDPLQRDVLAHAVNERLDELTPHHRAAYSRPSREDRPHSPPLAALVRLLEDTHLAPPERLPAAASAAGEALGVGITVYLVDYDQRRLHPLTPPGRAGDDGERKPLDIDTTLAGRAFRHVETLAAEVPDHPRLWMPLVDGVERLGVLEIAVTHTDDLYDPALRTQCRWLSTLLGHMVTLLNQHGDALDRVRLPAPRTVDGELIWSLLPPLTSGVDNFMVTGVVEPRQEVSGDAFDYALSETTANLIVLDAAGQDLRSGLIAAIALAAYRSARRAGHGLYEQARAIDEAIAKQFGEGAHATAVLVELDLTTGRLRHLNAGHPAPLVMREGKVVKPLTGGRRPPLGLSAHDLTIAEEALQPDDWLVLHTDGITEARGRGGEPFGQARLIDFLHREAAAGHPPPETARRLIQAVLNHQGGVLQDDATVLFARWTDPGVTT
ncbi:serine/threonine-protein phosphatase [Saccharothrix sp. S26]|uniref:PP2C family protein-serine/threonine phosphatase n=1 Tax=Saccharothrix sp. S26 TaxID=2907215 RepID=UPI001F408EE0|nr:PP2C family protein-serine/threonine phosphatase [Saccharothrix sp. S26]MCE6995452.1 serine/threonine-protein phosphatase [Saccharothrix sp. S26]